jgi:hypothetical protein
MKIIGFDTNLMQYDELSCESPEWFSDGNISSMRLELYTIRLAEKKTYM